MTKPNQTKIKIADMGTTGLIQWAITGNRRMMGARIGRAKKIIALRTGTWKAVNAFNKAVNAAYDRKEGRRTHELAGCCAMGLCGPEAAKAVRDAKRPQHTPGPWKVMHETKFHPCLVTANDADLAVVYGPSRDIREANARLIAAAPELLEALKTVRALQYDHSDSVRSEVERVVAGAIAKAEGK